ncbi:MAG: hypothetical protein JW936_06675 [Sedimentisphaerales bacterium]|nr:hypothetical protein [Sedimentisphaerales bacterium]
MAGIRHKGAIKVVLTRQRFVAFIGAMGQGILAAQDAKEKYEWIKMDTNKGIRVH